MAVNRQLRSYQILAGSEQNQPLFLHELCGFYKTLRNRQYIKLDGLIMLL